MTPRSIGTIVATDAPSPPSRSVHSGAAAPAASASRAERAETSLHESALPALAELMAALPRETQIWVTTHARGLAARGAKIVELEKVDGETRAVGARLAEPEDDEDAEG